MSNVVQTYCIKCHGQQTETDVRLDTLLLASHRTSLNAEDWHRVRQTLERGEMPPADQKQLTADERDAVLKWIQIELERIVPASADRRSSLRRLTRVEYQNTMRDLLGIDMDFARELPAEATSADGFRNDSRLLDMSPVHVEAFLESARIALGRVLVSGPRPQEYHHYFTESNVSKWKGEPHLSNQLGRQQIFLAKMEVDYPEQGEFLIRVAVEAEQRAGGGYPLLEVSLGYRPDTQILFREFPLVEVTAPGVQTYEFRGFIEDYPLPVRGQGKFPGLVIRVRNAYDDGSPLPEGSKDDNNKMTFPVEPHLPLLNVRSVEFHGPAFTTWPPAYHTRIMLTSDSQSVPTRSRVRRIISQFAERAFRRPLKPTELRSLVNFYDEIHANFPTYEDALREALAFVLIQPEFLYIHHPRDIRKSEEVRGASHWDVASRLTYFLWSSMPDQRLFDLAKNELLGDPLILRAEVERLLSSPKSSAFVDQFANQWLSLDVVHNVNVDPRVYPNFDPSLKSAMVEESTAFFAELLRSNASAMDFLAADFTMMNEPLAKHYGVEGVFGTQFRRVPFAADRHRGGLLGQSSVLLAGSTGADSHPVRRAVWIRDRLLNDPPAPPPANVPSLEAIDPKFQQLAMREKLEVHRSDPSCNICHRDLDPWGIALENFDAIGLWRDEVQQRHGDDVVSMPVSSKATFSNGTVIDGPDILKQHLVAEFGDRFASSLLRRLLTYALGRELDLVDEPSIRRLEAEFAAHDYRMRDLVHLIVSSDLFLGTSFSRNEHDQEVLAP